ncbi:elongation factor Ts, mitochondrial [Tribolium castaneum]|uniref:Elongation factor Ts, mitochondrial n=1 Tax=Tribolium castaneum TaxID=7070 RepID=D6WNZ5_TRICA|nr:PREDICTED: elongation factor Ts, mitochondrial [Tribolium castaneum]EFA03187.2 Elongation factor Ts, mitochondrial-like Protein [Tribolium castaneum]|eukprot:XP_974752.2 PREDICTED: elongation factor Ts, mitochondrial [Tribolium castaneum]
MISSKIFARFVHLQGPCLAAEKSLLATLRKKTGYTFSNCKKALELHNNDIKQAEAWLRQQAQSLGWAKATKLEGRQTSQGLIGLSFNSKNAALVEVNCETDFVARNKEFHKYVEEATLSCLNFAQTQPGDKTIKKISLNSDQMKAFLATDGKSLADHLALMIGTVGENASLKRGLCVKAPSDVHLVGYVHPSGSDGSVLLGKIGGLIALKQLSSKCADLDEIGKKLCQHIVGMNPQKIGTSDDEPAKDKEEEVCLIHQEFLLDDSVTVKEVLDEHEIEVVDFKRLECGGDTVEGVNQPLELIETCQ